MEEQEGVEEQREAMERPEVIKVQGRNVSGDATLFQAPTLTTGVL